MKFKSLLISLTLIISSQFAFAVDPSASIYTDHGSYNAANVYEFDIMIKADGSTSAFELRTFQAGLYLNPSWINGGTLSVQNVSTYTEMNGSGYNGAFQWNATDKLINCSVNFDVLGPVSCISTTVSSTPMIVTRIRLTNTNDFNCATPDIKFNYVSNINPLRLRTTFSWREIACTTNYDMFYPGRTYNGTAKFNNEVYANGDADGRSFVSSDNTGFCLGQLTLIAFLQGFYIGGGQMQPALYNVQVPHANTDQTDTLTIELRVAGNPEILAAPPIKTIVGTNGIANCFFDLSLVGGSYWIAIFHRNNIETWSKNPVTLQSRTTYNFSSASTQAYDDGFNMPMKLVDSSPTVWAIYNGDINRDGTVDSQDMTWEESDSNAALFGYNASDLTGDGSSDALDMTILENNSNIAVFASHP